MMLTIAPLLTPISETTPAGNEARSSEAYEAVAAEIEKLTSLSNTGPVDWALIEQQGAELLATQTKDFMLAAWLSAAWVERHGIEGLQAGLSLHAGYIDHYWETGFPPLKRVRGRRNALSWWIERSTQWLNVQALPALPPELCDTLVETAKTVDQRLSEIDPEAPALASFIRQLQNLDRLESAASLNPQNVLEAPQAPDPRAATPAMATGSPAVHNAPASALKSPDISLAALPAMPGDVTSLNDIITALNPVNHALGQLSTALMTLDRFQPLAIEMGRFAARSTVFESPPSQGHATTAIMPPPVAIADAFQTICEAGNALGIIEFCESRIQTFPFWLDLDFQSARGFAMLGEPGARMRQAVIKNVLSFVDRLPGIEQLKFSDGTPFASEQTKQWLDECKALQARTIDDNATEQAFALARKTLQTGDADAAVSMYHDLCTQTTTRRDQFRARIAMAELFISIHGNADPVPFVQALADECQSYRLADWEPDLAAYAWRTILDACRQALSLPIARDDPAKRARYQQLNELALQQLAAIDFPAAMRYSA